MERIAIIADDLTGACDTGVKFRNVGWETTVVVDAADGPDLHAVQAPVVAINTGTRSAAPEEARQAVQTVLHAATSAGLTLFYKKVDSILRGNCGAELEAFFTVLHPDFVLVAPAFPATGRRMRNGVIHIETGGEAPNGTVEGWKLLSDSTDRACGLISLETVRGGVDAVMQQAETLFREGKSILLADAWSEADLGTIAQAVLGFAGRCIPAGSAGLAGQMARLMAPSVPFRADQETREHGTVMVAVGTRHPVTVEQVRRLRVEAPCVPYLLKVEGLCQENLDARVTELLQHSEGTQEDGKGILLTTDGIYAGTERCSYLLRQNAYNRSILDGLGMAAERLAERIPVAGIVASGGDVSSEILRRLRLNLIQLVAEPIPGIVMGIAAGKDGRRIHLATKSGGFGDPDALLTIYNYLSSHC